ncbi:ATP-binding protein [Catalinimonas niigatensis]|uniref:ATP-binding protein n=1 Tax=Catalinimonas niigatensis TaxID=1397264 RepID=UPI002665008B|nr:ATP-binding protein [Catalinimonas niigatensis]WPP49297.1 ATP-binding protein [Catalinimonas niigatensis]
MQGDSPLQAHINETEAITLAYDQSVFSIEYAGLNYTDPGKTRYKYRLEGFVDESWQEVGSERKVTYTNLEPGQYTFVVTSEENEEGLEHLQRTLSITVTPPWWQTWWARSLMILFIASTVLGIYKLRIRNIKAHNRTLEKEVRERTLKLQQANTALQRVNEALHDKNLQIQEQKEEIQAQAEELVESNEEIKAINQRLEESIEVRTADLRKSNQELDNFVYRVSHDIRAPLSSILGLVDLIEDEKDPQQLRAYLKMATKSIHKLDSFVKDILDYSRNARMEPVLQKVNFPELLQEVREELQYMENASRIKIIEEYQLSKVHYNDIRRLQIIFRNLFSNAIKYQNLWIDDSYLKIKVDTNEQTARITVEDNGIGINDAQRNKVFEMFYRGSDLSNGSGIGLYIVKETIEKLGGSIDLQSQLGVGTTIKINLPSMKFINTPLESQQ